MNLDEKRGKHLAELRIKNNLKQSDLAKMIGYSNKSISKWERGICFPKDTKVLIELTNIFNVSLDELLQGEDSDIECKIIPQSKNKYLNFIIKNRVVFIIILICLLLILFLFYYFVIEEINNNVLLLNGGSKYDVLIENKDSKNIEFSDDSLLEDSKENITSSNKRKDEKEIHKILLDEEFVYTNNVLNKEINDDVFIYYIEETFSFKIYDYSNILEFYIIHNSVYFNKFYIDKYIEGRPETFYIENDEIKNCNIEKCVNYLDYAMYINYIKNLILN